VVESGWSTNGDRRRTMRVSRAMAQRAFSSRGAGARSGCCAPALLFRKEGLPEEFRQKRQHAVVGEEEIGPQSGGGQAHRQRFTEKSGKGVNTFPLCNHGDVQGRLDPQHGNPARDEVPEHVTVIARRLHYEASTPELQLAHQVIGTGTTVIEHALRRAREIAIVTKECLRWDRLRDLQKRAAATQHEIERVGWLDIIKLITLQQTVGQRGVPEVENRREATGTANPTQNRGGLRFVHESEELVPARLQILDSGIHRSFVSTFGSTGDRFYASPESVLAPGVTRNRL